MKKYIYQLFAFLVLIVSPSLSCSKWLDVKPSDRVIDEELFSTPDGYKSSLNGIYLDLNHDYLYGKDMLFDFIDILAQRYKFDGLSGSQTELVVNYNYEEQKNKERIQLIWEKYYNLILNCNKLLHYAEKDVTVLNPVDRKLIIGEAKALRAFLHFDVLRLWGPIYSKQPEATAIPYNSEYKLSAGDLLSAKKIVENLFIDLEAAATLLKEVDPIIEKGPLTEDSEDGLNAYTYRTQRMNYYAVKAMQARVYQYCGKNDEAVIAAKEVTAVQEKWFPFIQYKNIIGNSESPDRIFSTELLFCITNSSRGKLFENYFSPELVSGHYSPQDKELERIFGSTKEKDYRYSPIWIYSNKTSNRAFHKYEDVKEYGQMTSYANIIPLIRMSEMFYIIAECSSNSEEALNAINTIYDNRGLDKVKTIENMREALTVEYMKEFYGEGQLFFYYKRLNEQQIFCPTSNTTIGMNDSKYILPLPLSETDYR